MKTNRICAGMSSLSLIFAVVMAGACKAKEAMDGSVSMPRGGDAGMMKDSPSSNDAPFDLQFLDSMSAHHQGAIEMAQDAADKTQKGELKTFAGKIILDQQGEIAEMRRLRIVLPKIRTAS